LLERFQRGRDTRLGAAVDDDAGVGRQQAFGDGVADAGRGAADQGLLARQIDVHGNLLGE
jgi:hypothetical protein